MNEIEIMQKAMPTALVIQFSSSKTPGDVYEHSISCIDQAIDFVIALASPELLRALELKFAEWGAKVVNARTSLMQGKVVERASFEELRAAEKLAEMNSKAWTIEHKKPEVRS